jgi:hypothetical protein
MMDNSANCIICPTFTFFSYLCVVVKERAELPQTRAFSPRSFRFGKSYYFIKVVGVTGFEPVTLRLSSACSNQLSYTPMPKTDMSWWS